MEQLRPNNRIEIPAIGLGVYQTPAEETRDAVPPPWTSTAGRSP